MVRWPSSRCITLFAATALLLAPALSGAADAVLEEKFGANSPKYFFEGVLDDRVFSYVDGEYEIDTTNSQSYGQSVVIENFSTYRLEARGRVLEASNPEAGFGLSFNYHQQDNGDNEFLLFLVYDRGAYTVLKYSGGRTQVLASPRTTALFDPGGNVLLTVDATKGQLAFYINGAEVIHLRETELVAGGVGMFATSGAVVRFDDFIVAADAPDPGLSELSFDSNSALFDGDWGGVKYRHEGGGYTIDTLGTELIGLSPFADQAFDFEFAVDVELVDGDPVNGFGIYIRDFSNEDGGFNQYRFLVSGEWFAVERSEGLWPLALSAWEKHTAVRAAGANRLKVVARGESIRFFINGLEVWSGTDPQPQPGSFGLYAAGGTKVRFDNVSIRRF